ncbi:hypothetical protein RDI58_000980 [Solanum bulbocastanum]|uniref:DUF4283 domain-containing protein n=1 Tax=Solanum bulbocastanum TaxID=147425 RepID=A0AAN8UDD5_SOLBU
MNLTYIPSVIVEGEKVVEILAEDVAQDNEKWAPSIVVYVVGTTLSIGAVERFILGQGTFSAKPVILYHRDGNFVLRFANAEERDMSCVDKLAAHPQVQKKIQGQGQKKEWIPITVIGKEQANEIGKALPQAEEVTDQPEIDVAWVTGARNPSHTGSQQSGEANGGSMEDKPVGSQVQDAKTRDFPECLIDCNLAELHIGGREYTSNEHVCSRIDKALVNDAWMEKMKHPEFRDRVQASWQILGGGMEGIWRNLKMVRREMQKLNKDEFMGVSDRVQMLRREIINKQINMRVIPIPQNMIDMEKILRAELAKWSQIEDDICKQKSRIQWLS